MIRTGLAVAAAAMLGAGAASAGGVERSAQSMALLFERGNYAEFGLSYSRPRVSGEAPAALGGAGSGDMARSFTTFNLGVRGDLSDALSYAFIIDEPIGASVEYPAGTGYFIAGSNARIQSTAVTGVLRYQFDGGFSAHAGLRAVRTRGEVELFNPMLPGGTYTMNARNDTAVGYLAGVAWERPDIAARVALTYNSRVKHSFDATETNVAWGGAAETTFDTTIPESLQLEFQTGVAEDTLLFGSLRYARWTRFEIAPENYTTILGQNPLVEYESNSLTWNIGVGRQFNENWSGAVSLGYERKSGDALANLGPTDGYRSIGVGVTYREGPIMVATGIQYRRIGGGETAAGARFSGNSALGLGVRVGISF
ncbi:hypothetical protein HUK65_07085 [Rhodobacteraceae bacterium 2376]|uniref:Long-subunit fatty acid transport protein n=1 Tax=Rhabdonatronobacter sediminivivens TaxID=2743469 RepID=A0A7Z0KXV7_9RHOB|nr:outer membrane protein transport protein [Rhabdonatronobacter sediminivivens]NYS24754.1 hypothetical protein [Rhabdonatronobacter sediminivivens]